MFGNENLFRISNLFSHFLCLFRLHLRSTGIKASLGQASHFHHRRLCKHLRQWRAPEFGLVRKNCNASFQFLPRYCARHKLKVFKTGFYVWHFLCYKLTQAIGK